MSDLQEGSRPKALRCPICKNKRESLPCWNCTRACRRKVAHPDYERAWFVREQLYEKDGWEDPTLQIYVCKLDASHFHVGHATGMRGRRAVKRAEKARRKALIIAYWAERGADWRVMKASA